MLKKGDRIVVPFNVSCGHCRNCAAMRTGYCTTVTPNYAGGAYGLGIGAYDGGQAQFLRVPWAISMRWCCPRGGRWRRTL